MNHHRIRLRGPWQCTIAPGDLAPIMQTIIAPCLIPEIAEGISFRIARKLGRPSTLLAEEAVYLVIKKPGYAFKVFWNQKDLGVTQVHEDFEYPIKEHLLERNHLEMEGFASKVRTFIFEETFLEIRIRPSSSLA
ncbi:MAG: hypothetical protein EBT92_17045 [Planctomycetes bacterium]|nr:hypothetical protein [Planctomycetota bacterium]NBY00709.1 hypothetical protein [Planctomycetota bacterium]